MTNLNFVVLFVLNAKRSCDFYEKALGGRVQKVGDNKKYIELNVGTVSLAVIEYEYIQQIAPELNISKEDAGKKTSYISFAIQDIHKYVNDAKDLGGTVVTEPREVPWGGTMAFLKDPDGHIIELYQKY